MSHISSLYNNSSIKFRFKDISLFLRRYGSNIYGLTGTLGSESAQNLLSKIYGVDNVIIPPFRKKQFKELRPVIIRNKESWYEAICENSLGKLNCGRGVLIINKYIDEVDEIGRKLVEDYKYDKSKIKFYKTDKDSNVVQEEIKPGEIIIATNIAGRGTDIRAEQIEINGGLHVCVTFLPPNKRVEHQNIGKNTKNFKFDILRYLLKH
jgi:preprotein translocase subunit SecA